MTDDDIVTRAAAEVAAGEWWSQCHDRTLAPSDLANLIRERDAEVAAAAKAEALADDLRATVAGDGP